jgi:CzcA family heavy metal efflux pump
MMRGIVRWSLRFRFLVLGLAVALTAVGAARVGNMPVDVFPEFAPPRVEIQTEAVGLSTIETEELITIPLEQALHGVPGLDVLRSKSVLGLSSILLLFEPGTDVLAARQLVEERLISVVPTLPDVARPPVILQPLSSTSRALKIGVSSTEMSALDLSELMRFTIRPRLLTVPGVANVAVWGERKRQLQVRVDPERLRANGVTLNQVHQTTAGALEVGLLSFSSNAVIGTGGWVETPTQRLPIRHVLAITSPAELARVPVIGAPSLRLGDVAEIVEGAPPLIGDGVVNGGPGLLLIVEKFPWANTLDVTHGIERALEDLKPAMPGVQVDATIFRPATFIELAVHNLLQALLIGCLLVAIVLALFLFEWRTALISLTAIPLSLIAAVLVLDLRGATINTMVLAGFVIAVGVVVDDAIIDVENIVRRLRLHRQAGGRGIVRVVLDASLEVRSAIVYATLIDVVVLVPVLFIEGLSGAFFRPLAISYGLAVLASMAVALTVTPALALLLLRGAPIDRRESPLVRWLQARYQRVLGRTVRRPRPAYAVVAATILAGLAVWPLLGQSLLPSFKERDFLMHWVTAPGTSHPEMVRITNQAAQELQAIPGVRNFGAHIGRAVAADEVVGINFTENWISVDPAADYDRTVGAVREAVDGYPGLYRDVQTYLQERVKEVLTGSSDSIVVRIFGPDMAVLRQKAEEVRQALVGIEGIVDLNVELQVEEPQIQIRVDTDAARQHGLKPGDVIRAAGAMVNSIEVGDIFWEGKVYDVNVRGVPATVHSLSSLEDMLIDTPRGGQVRLADIASVRVVPAPNAIKREDSSRRIDVGANVRGRDLGVVARDVEARLRTVQFSREYYPQLLGEYAERQAAQRRLLGLAVAAVVGVFLLLLAAFGSWRLATLLFATLPSALVGGVLAAYLGGGVISLGSLVGFFTVLGIAARNGIMLINHYQHLERHEGERLGLDLVLRGARERLSPILMTALATGLALVPLVVMGDIPGHEVELPMAVVILGGLVTSTLLNVFVMPALYLRFARSAVQAADEPATASSLVARPAGAGAAGGGG